MTFCLTQAQFTNYKLSACTSDCERSTSTREARTGKYQPIHANPYSYSRQCECGFIVCTTFSHADWTKNRTHSFVWSNNRQSASKHYKQTTQQCYHSKVDCLIRQTWLLTTYLSRFCIHWSYCWWTVESIHHSMVITKVTVTCFGWWSVPQTA